MSSSLRRSNLLIILWLSISIFGILSIYSASMPELIIRGSLPFSMALVQTIIFIVCILILVVLLKMKKKAYNLVVKLIDPIFYFSIISLVLVKIIGSSRGGAQMVIDLFIFDYQPVELYKIAVILYMAKHLTGKNKPKTFSELMFLCIKAGSGCILLFLQPDLGGMLIVAALIYLMACLYG
ncbi:MAG: FtsW/RodA/SpoVE family cell cycle protein, partial [Mycoplasmatales bacterium]